MWHLDNFSNEKLIDIVKNYEMYKYDISVKFEALKILENRGIEEKDLALVGNETDSKQFKLKSFYTSYKRNSIFAFTLYVSLIALNFFVNSYALLFIFLTFYIVYLVCLVISFINQKDFYTALNKPLEASAAITYIFIGMPFYPIFYFFSLKRMNKHII